MLASRLNEVLARFTGLEIRRVGHGRAGRADVGSRASGPFGEPQAPPASTFVPSPGSGFFDEYPAFFDTSHTAAIPTRLNLRHEAIIERNREIFDGARVLDIASHDGRWSFAAVRAGASGVIGIEARSELVSHAHKTFASYDVPSDRYRFIVGDVYDVLVQEDLRVDVVMCLGFLYHTLRYNELMARIADCRPEYVVIDTEVALSTDPVVRLQREIVSREGNAVADRFSRRDRMLTGRPSRSAIAWMLEAYGFEVDRETDWPGLLRNRETDASVDVYAKEKRITIRGRSTTPQLS